MTSRNVSLAFGQCALISLGAERTKQLIRASI